ncbi:hypothetical protein AB1Y20_021556 [Prymnesium parvum]|uniref:Cyclic nucleotide-binding domain-containing protein n=1 Tax=Prymnesium parvum TaxID=97485 RepID=A0AB34JKH2_PRYPA
MKVAIQRSRTHVNQSKAPIRPGLRRASTLVVLGSFKSDGSYRNGFSWDDSVSAAGSVTTSVKSALNQNGRHRCEKVIQVCVALFYLFVVPYQIGFETDVAFNTLYAIGYCFDTALVFTVISLLTGTSRAKRLEKLREMLETLTMSAEASGSKGSKKRKVSDVRWLVLLVVLPFDALFWASTSRELLPFFRLTRFGYALFHAHKAVLELESSQTVPFTLCRLVRLMSFTLLFTHVLGCAFLYLTSRPAAYHFSTAPWLAPQLASPGVGTRYLRSMYWSFISFTTAGHKDVVGEDWSHPGRNWEAFMAFLVAFVVTFAFMYMNANFTSLVIRANSRLLQYRVRLGQVNAYLRRNKVSSEVCKRVRRYFARQQQSALASDKAILQTLPTSLQKEVMRDIHARTLKLSPTLATLEPAALGQLCAVVHTVMYLPEETIIQHGDVVMEMYFLEEGAVAYLDLEEACGESGDTIPHMACQRGTPMCELGFLFGLRQEVTLEALLPSRCCVLRKHDFNALRKQLPELLARMQEAVLSRMREEADPRVEEVERTLVPSDHARNRAADLFSAAAAGRIDLVRALVHDGVSVAEIDYVGRTPLHVAAASSRLEVVEFLISVRAGLSARDHSGRTPLTDAVEAGNSYVVKALRDAGGELGWGDVVTAGKLCERVREGNMAELRLLLSCGAKVNAADYDSRVALHLAASEGSSRVCELLLAHKANVNAVDRWGGTPLYGAICEGHYAVAKELRLAGAELRFDGVKASNELCELARSGMTERLQLLLDCGCNINAADYDQRTCLHLTASVGNMPMVKKLVEMKADVNARDRFGSTPLFDAVRNGFSHVARVLTEFGGILGQTEARVSSTLCELARLGSLEKVETMLSCDVNISAADYDRRTSLHLAACEGNLPIVKMLVNSGAGVNLTDRWGNTPLFEAVREGHRAVAQFLLSRGAKLGLAETTTGNVICQYARAGKFESVEVLVSCGAKADAQNYNHTTALHVAAAEGHKGIAQTLLKLGVSSKSRNRGNRTPQEEAERAGNHWPVSFWEIWSV